jgi:hypothetical protein
VLEPVPLHLKAICKLLQAFTDAALFKIDIVPLRI